AASSSAPRAECLARGGARKTSLTSGTASRSRATKRVLAELLQVRDRSRVDEDPLLLVRLDLCEANTRRFIRLAELPGDLDDVQFVGRPNNAVTAGIDVDGHDSLPDSIGLRYAGPRLSRPGYIAFGV